MRKYLFLIILAANFLFQKATFAQTSGDEFKSKTSHSITAGYNFGATAPYSLPNNIRKIEKYS
ncbi:MAG: hypothetical protein EOP48_32895, partial [Sphingobacteriales bacterium]